MTGLQIYILALPLIVAAIGWAAVYAWMRISDREDRRAR